MNESVVVDFVFVIDEDSHVNIGFNQRLAELVIFHHLRGRLPVVAEDEFADKGIDIQVWIPEQFVHHPGLHLIEFASCRLIVSLFEDSEGLVLTESPDVGSENLEIRPGGGELGVVHDIVPDEQVGGNFAPFADIFHEFPVLGAVHVFERMGETALDAAEPDYHVVAGNDPYGRFAGVLVCESSYELVGEFFPDGIGNLVDKPKQDSGMPAVAVFEGLAFFALAIPLVVVLGKAVDAVERLFPHHFFEACLANFQDLRIGKTELSVAIVSFSVPEAEVFRMGTEELFHRHEHSHRMRAPIAFKVAVSVRYRAPVHIFPVVGLPYRIACDGIVGIPVS